MKQYIRTNDEGVKVLNYDELDMAARANFIADLERWSKDIEVDGDEDASNADWVEGCDITAAVNVDNMLGALYDDDGDQPEVEDDTRQMMISRISDQLVARYNLEA